MIKKTEQTEQTVQYGAQSVISRVPAQISLDRVSHAGTKNEQPNEGPWPMSETNPT
jgi:hypothetical protein